MPTAAPQTYFEKQRQLEDLCLRDGPCQYIAASSTVPKRLIVCCDGTFCATNQGKEANATNISKLSRVIANVGVARSVGADGKMTTRQVPQIVNYQSGIGTGFLTALNKDLEGAFGDGLNEKVCEAYTYLVNNYGPGDEIFVFGFSRGAYTARALAFFICLIGLLSPGMMDYFNEIFNAYKGREKNVQDFESMAWAKKAVQPGELGFTKADQAKKGNLTRYEWIRQWTHYHVAIKVVGVYDTVGSLGLSGWLAQPGQDVTFQSSKLHPKIRHAFHALALDEHRGNFAPTMYYLDKACEDAGVDLHQCWFPGYHADVGGQGEPQDDVTSVDEITFAWMIDHLVSRDLLQINKRALEYPVLQRLNAAYLPNHAETPAPKTAQEVYERRIQWSDGTLQETDSHFWDVASWTATGRSDYVRQPGEYIAYEGGDKTSPRVDYRKFNETVHPCVWHRINTASKEVSYWPRALPAKDWQRVKLPQSDKAGRTHAWVKQGKQGVVQIPEFVIYPAAGKGDDREFWIGSLERKIAPIEHGGENIFPQSMALPVGNGKPAATSHV